MVVVKFSHSLFSFVRSPPRSVQIFGTIFITLFQMGRKPAGANRDEPRRHPETIELARAAEEEAIDNFDAEGGHRTMSQDDLSRKCSQAKEHPYATRLKWSCRRQKTYRWCSPTGKFHSDNICFRAQSKSFFINMRKYQGIPIFKPINSVRCIFCNFFIKSLKLC